jgi:hypothetical protein
MYHYLFFKGLASVPSFLYDEDRRIINERFCWSTRTQVYATGDIYGANTAQTQF